MVKALTECRVVRRYLTTIRHIYNNVRACLRLHNFRIEKRVRQADVSSTKLFNTLEHMFNQIDFGDEGKELNQLRFAYDIVFRQTVSPKQKILN